MLRFEVETIKHDRRGVHLEMRECWTECKPGTDVWLRCSAGPTGSTFVLNFQKEDPLYEKYASLPIGATVVLSLG